MRRLAMWTALAVIGVVGTSIAAPAKDVPATTPAAASADGLRDESSVTSGSVAVGGRTLAYQAEAGLLVVHTADPADEDPKPADAKGPIGPSAAMSYVAYSLGKEADPRRPITFVFNGGPGSATIWLRRSATIRPLGPRSSGGCATPTCRAASFEPWWKGSTRPSPRRHSRPSLGS